MQPAESIPSAIVSRVAQRVAGRPWTPPAYWLTRFVILRLIGVVYGVAFLVVAHQGGPLFGQQGLLPADLYMERLVGVYGSRWEACLHVPSLFWLHFSDAAVRIVAGWANAVIMLVLWALYMSIINIGQLWYGYGWEIQLLETGMLGVFLCPLWDARPFPRTPPPTVIIWLFRWLGFRVMLGAGLIKLRGDSCWRELTCLVHHYETQPIPNPLSRWIHFQPVWIHKLGALFNHFVELIAPWFAFGPRHVRHVAGCFLVAFQLALIASGNLSFLNWVTLVPMLACFDDSWWRRLLPRRLVAAQERAVLRARPSRLQTGVVLAYATLVAVLSVGPVKNMLSPRQAMNRSFDRLSLVNTYGAFGSVGDVRREIVFEGTDEDILTGATVWNPYAFKAKPGDPMRRPRVISPYQLRVDWQIWFAAMSTPQAYPWTIHFVWKLLHNDPGALSLLAGNPFPDRPPRHVRAVLYEYRFAPADDPTGAWWQRTVLGLWLPPLASGQPALREFIRANGWEPDDAGP